MKRMLLGLWVLLIPAGAALAGGDMARADVVVLGEVHDNPRHHEVQAELVRKLRPRAIVFEMLDARQAARITPQNRADMQALRDALGWDQSGWPDFSMYYPIFAAAPQARVFGAGIPRDKARAALGQGVVAYFGPEAARYGLDRPLGAEELAARVAFQSEVHCGALPDEMLPAMVELQRLRDAQLARTVGAALEQTGPPVVVITGNGHARRDRGLAVYLGAARPDVAVFVLGQSEDGRIEGVFDAVRDAPAVARPDPCLAFEKRG